MVRNQKLESHSCPGSVLHMMGDPCDPALYPPASLAGSLAELNSTTEWFHYPDRPSEAGPFVVVVDDFYDDPDEIRRIALDTPFFQYFPPCGCRTGHPQQ
jgi:hypothetical protein